MVNIFTQTCPDDLGVGASDNADRIEDVLEQYYVREVMKIFFYRQISKVRPHKMSKKVLFWPLVKVLVRIYA